VKKLIVFIFFLFLLVDVSAKKVSIKADNKALSEILVSLREKYKTQLSFNSHLLSDYKLSLNKTFESEEKAIAFLIKKFPLDYDFSNGVFLIYSRNKVNKYRIFGKIIDEENREILPFSHLTINSLPYVTDVSGNFSFTSEVDSVFHVLVSHLGYYMLDTIVKTCGEKNFFLQPASTDLPEIKVCDHFVQTFLKQSNQAGNVLLNHKIAGFLPTNNDNSVFELLRLQPGIVAAGEQKEDLIIWGSYQGESQVLFDNITLWGLKNLYEDIGAVNPLVAKNINILKGGYNAKYGDRIGGIVYVTGKSGNRIKPELNLSLNNITASGSLEVPIGKKISTLVAFRRTYYNLFKDEQIKYASKNIKAEGKDDKFVMLNVTPDYTFYDGNFKFSLYGDNGDHFYISTLFAKDDYKYDVKNKNLTTWTHKDENNIQYGASINYDKIWKSGNSSTFSFSRSSLSKTTKNNIYIKNNNDFGPESFRKDYKVKNEIVENKLNINNKFALSEEQNVEFGLNYTNNSLILKEDSLKNRIVNKKTNTERYGIFFQNNLHLDNGLLLKAGFRLNYHNSKKKLFWEPRISMSYKLSDAFSVNAAWGIYKQFISKSTKIDANGNVNYSWIGVDTVNVPVLESIHKVLGGSYHKNGLTLSLEGYHKQSRGHVRYVKNQLSIGKSRSYGVDFFVKKDIKDHTIWASYTLGRTEENFDYFNLAKDEYRRALQDQRYEFKVAGLYSLKPFYFSANYIYGSGFPIYKAGDEVIAEPYYHRLDAAVIYKLNPRKFKCEFGVLFQNIFNSKNLNYDSSEKVPFSNINSISIFTETVPSSIRLYFKIRI